MVKFIFCVASALNLILEVIETYNLLIPRREPNAEETSKTTFSEHESSIAGQVVDQQAITTTFNDIGGHTDVIEKIKATVLLPLRKPTLSSKSKLLQPPKGILLYGPPGCGKTMLAKAVAKEAGAKFIDLDVSKLTSKEYGESQKKAAALFTYAQNNKPCIIFIDEIDSLLRSRSIGDNETTAMMKATFLTQLDGLLTEENCQVVVMGATNRPQDVDEAILRRLPAKFYIALPTRDKRVDILANVLRGELIAEDIDLNEIADMTEGFSGSDLKELCREAAMIRFLDLSSSGFGATEQVDQLKSITLKDFTTAIHKMKESKILITTGHSALPTGHSALPTGHSALPTGHSALPTGHSALPTGHSALPTGHSALPTRSTTSQVLEWLTVKVLTIEVCLVMVALLLYFRNCPKF